MISGSLWQSAEEVQPTAPPSAGMPLPARVDRQRLSQVDAEASSSAQASWSATPLRQRLRVLRAGRHSLAARAEELADAISPTLQRTRADTLVTEVLPLLDACKFLERQAERILRPRTLGRRGRPFWLRGVQSEVQRVPLGRVLIIAPGNFPLFLPGVQALQALAAGNTVVWKPGEGGEAVAQVFAKTMADAGLPAGALEVTGEAVEFAASAIGSNPNKVVFTGSSNTGRRILEQLAPRLIPAVLELSGADAVIVLASADLPRVAKAVAFALRLNGGAVCMSPRRLFGTAQTLQRFVPLLESELQKQPPVAMNAAASRALRAGVAAARADGASVIGDVCPEAQRPLLLLGAQPGMQVTREAFFAPILALIEAPSESDLPRLHDLNPYALTASIFGNEAHARALASKIRAGSVLINDIIAPTADPRVPFGGRGESGYGLTRGPEGLLEMTTTKVIQRRTGRATRHYEPTRDKDVPLFAGLIQMIHGGRWTDRVRALRTTIKAARKHKQSA